MATKRKGRTMNEAAMNQARVNQVMQQLSVEQAARHATASLPLTSMMGQLAAYSGPRAGDPYPVPCEQPASPKNPGLGGAIGALHQDLGVLDNALAVLFETLRPVMVNTNDVKVGSGEVPYADFDSPLYQGVCEASARVRRIASDVTRLAATLQL